MAINIGSQEARVVGMSHDLSFHRTAGAVMIIGGVAVAAFHEITT